MAQKENNSRRDIYIAFTSGIIAVLAAIASFQASGYSSLMLEEKNNSILYQNKANKQWNNYLAGSIISQILKKPISLEQMSFQQKANDLENQVAGASQKFQTYFQKNSNLVIAGTFFEIAIALSSLSVLIRRKSFWIFSLLLAGVGIYFLVLGFV